MANPRPGAALPTDHLPSDRSDAEAVEVALAASGDTHAFERLYRAHVAQVHSLARRMLGEEHADEVTQDIFVRAWQKLSVDFEAAIERLPPGAREVFVLHDVEGYRHEEIAGLLGVAVGTSKSQLHHARMALRRHLDR